MRCGGAWRGSLRWGIAPLAGGAPSPDPPGSHTVIRQQLSEALRAQLLAAGVEVDGEIHLEQPARREHGDWSSNVAMANAKRLGRNPRELAADLVERLNAEPPAHVERSRSPVRAS